MREFFGHEMSKCMTGMAQFNSSTQKKISTIRMLFLKEFGKQIPPHFTMFELCLNKNHPMFAKINFDELSDTLTRMMDIFMKNLRFVMCDDAFRVLGKYVTIRYDIITQSDDASSKETARQSMIDLNMCIISYLEKILNCQMTRRTIDDVEVFSANDVDVCAMPSYDWNIENRVVHISLFDASNVDFDTFVNAMTAQYHDKLNDLNRITFDNIRKSVIR